MSNQLFSYLFDYTPMSTIFSDENRVQKWLDVEAALAEAQAELGLFSADIAATIRAHANVELLDLDHIAKGYESSITMVPALNEFKRILPGDTGEYVHWGATTQDIFDTGMILQLREAHTLLTQQLDTIYRHCLRIADAERHTPMAGRTHLIQALPITLGFKFAVFADELNRHRERLAQLAPRLFRGELSGAVGTMASEPVHGLETQRRLMQKLDLAVPNIAWFSARDTIAEYVSTAGLIAGTIGKIAQEIMSLSRTEIGELEEPFFSGKVGSSTMPHKRNPQTTENIIGLTREVRAYVPTMLECMLVENERDFSVSLNEFPIIERTSIALSAALHKLDEVLGGLIIYRDHMRRNLDILQGLILSEAVMMQLADRLGRLTAHHLVYELCMQAYEQERPLAELLKANSQITSVLSDDDIDRLMDPTQYLGQTQAFIDQVLAAAK